MVPSCWIILFFALSSVAHVYVHGFVDTLTFYRTKDEANRAPLLHPSASGNERLLCTNEMLRVVEHVNTKQISENEEDALLELMESCQNIAYAVDHCVIGHAQAIYSRRMGPMAFYFINKDSEFCAEIYVEAKTGDQYVAVKLIRNNTKLGEEIWQNGTRYQLTETHPFLSVVRTWNRDRTPIYTFEPCLLDAYRYPFIAHSNGFFGLKKSGLPRSKIAPPRKTFMCNLSQNRQAFDRLTAHVSAEMEHNILQTVADCIDGKSNSCVLGMENTIRAFERGDLMVLLITRECTIMTTEYLNSVTGEKYLTHHPYDSNLRGEDIILGGKFHFFKSCIPFIEYAADIKNNHTMIVRGSSCNRNLNDFLLSTKYQGIAGIYLFDPRPRKIDTNYNIASGIPPHWKVGPSTDNSKTYLKNRNDLDDFYYSEEKKDDAVSHSNSDSTSARGSSILSGHNNHLHIFVYIFTFSSFLE